MKNNNVQNLHSRKYNVYEYTNSKVLNPLLNKIAITRITCNGYVHDN